MSIVERALGRIKNSVPSLSPAPESNRRPSSRPRREERSVPLSAPAVTPARVPKQSIEVSLESLRASGVLGAPEHADALADQFRRIKWPLINSAMGKSESENAPEAGTANIIMVTSSVSGEGKTFTSFNLAMSIAREKDLSLLLVDADIAKRHATRAMGAEDRKGLTEVLSDSSLDVEGFILGTNISGLTFLPAGRRHDSAPELFASERMIDVVNALRAADPRRIVLFDSSPLLATNESQVLGRVVDQVVFVVRAEVTTQPMVTEAVSLLDRSKEIRCILNQARGGDLGEYYYGYGGYYPNESQQKD